jgi:hypothetical protein
MRSVCEPPSRAYYEVVASDGGRFSLLRRALRSLAAKMGQTSSGDPLRLHVWMMKVAAGSNWPGFSGPR